MFVESALNPLAVGDNGDALGVLQMHKEYVQDAAEFAEEDWVHSDAIVPRLAAKIFHAYMGRYATEKRLGRPVTLEDIARIHNGGPNGYRNPATKKYWNLVKARLDEL